MQKILYQTKTVYTFEEYSRYNKTVQIKLNKVRLMEIILSLPLVCSSAMSFWYRQYPTAVLFLATAVGIPVIFEFMFSKKMKKYFYQNKKLCDMTASYNFYKDHMSQDNNFGHGSIYYKDIYKIIETDTNFYIMLSKRQGSIIVKENCSDELIDFIRQLKEEAAKKK